MDEVTEGLEQVSLDGEHQSAPLSTDPASSSVDLQDLAGLPSVLIITNVADSVFEEPQTKQDFESVFQEFERDAIFHYLKSFRRARVTFKSPISAAKARIHLNESSVCGKTIKCYFAQPLDDEDTVSAPTLQPPAPQRQFLISPPASPPVGWEPVPEAQPVLNYDLIAALANLAPGEAHELHPPSDKHPGIVVHICEDPAGFASRPKLQQTRCPVRKS